MKRLDKSNLPLLYSIVFLVISGILIVYFLGPDSMIGNGGDGFLWLFFANNFKERALDLKNPYYTEKMFYPVGRETYFYNSSSPVILSIMSFFSLFFNYIVSYNLTLVFIFCLNFLVMYKFSYKITGKNEVSILIALMFTVSPFNYSTALGHLNMIAVFVFPLAALAFIEEKYEYLPVILLMTFLICLEYLLYVIATLLVLSIAFRRRVSKNIEKITLSLILSVFLVSAVFFPALEQYSEESTSFNFERKSNYLEPWSLFLPNAFSTPILFVPKEVFVYDMYGTYSGDESLKGIGIVASSLFFYSIYQTAKNYKKKLEPSAIIFYAALTMYLLIFTPVYDTLLSFPVLNSLRVKNRIAISSIFLIFTFISMSLKEFKIDKNVLIGLIIIHIILSIPVNEPYVTVKDIDKLGPVGESEAIVLNVPCFPFNYFANTVHDRPSIDGLFTRAEKESTQMFRTLLDSCDNKEYDDLSESLRALDVEYAIIAEPHLQNALYEGGDECTELYYCIKESGLEIEEINLSTETTWKIPI